MAIIVSDTGPGPRRAGGGKLARSETVTVRLDPKLNYLCELAARAQRRTKSSFIEWAIEQALDRTDLPGVVHGGDPVRIAERAQDLWQVDEPDRLVKLAFVAPALLTHEEQLIWRTIREYGYLWRGTYKSISDTREKWTWEVDEFYLNIHRLRDEWEDIKQVAMGEADRSILRDYTDERMKDAPPGGGFTGGFSDDLDSDVPF